MGILLCAIVALLAFAAMIAVYEYVMDVRRAETYVDPLRESEVSARVEGFSRGEDGIWRRM